MRILEKIRIGSVDYTVEMTDNNVVVDNQACYGSISYTDHVIKIDKKLGDRQRVELTMLHEMFHGVLHERGIKIDDEESIVESLAKGLHQIVRDNQEMFLS